MSADKARERPDPEDLLARVMRDEQRSKRGYHKVFLGFAAGVGKTYETLTEANRRRQRGEDVVIPEHHQPRHARGGAGADQRA